MKESSITRLPAEPRGREAKAQRLGFELEHGALVEGRASGEIAGGDGLVEEIEQLLAVGGSEMSYIALAASSDEHILTKEFRAALLTDRPI